MENVFKLVQKAVIKRLKLMNIPIKDEFVENKFTYPCLFTELSINEISDVSPTLKLFDLDIHVLLHTPKRDKDILYTKGTELRKLFNKTLKVDEIGNINILDTRDILSVQDGFYNLTLNIKFYMYEENKYETMLDVKINNEKY